MATRNAKTTPTTTPAVAAAEPAATPAVPVAFEPTALAASVEVAPAMPKMSGGGAGKVNPFAELVARSFTEKVVLKTAVMPNAKNVQTVRNMLRRAAAQQGIAVAVRSESVAGGFVVYFEAKAKPAGK